MDEIEQAYERAIVRESADPDRAMELATGLREYRELYKVPAELPQGREGTR